MHLISPQEKAHEEGLHEVAMGHNDVIIIPLFVDIVPTSLHRLTELRGSVVHIAAGLPFWKPVMESAQYLLAFFQLINLFLLGAEVPFLLLSKSRVFCIRVPHPIKILFYFFESLSCPFKRRIIKFSGFSANHLT